MHILNTCSSYLLCRESTVNYQKYKQALHMYVITAYVLFSKHPNRLSKSGKLYNYPVCPLRLLTATTHCDPGWLQYRSDCYLFGNDSLQSWINARHVCYSYNADLTTIRDPYEQSFITGEIGGLHPASYVIFVCTKLNFDTLLCIEKIELFNLVTCRFVIEYFPLITIHYSETHKRYKCNFWYGSMM